MLQKVLLRQVSLVSKTKFWAGDNHQSKPSHLLSEEELRKFDKYVTREVPHQHDSILSPGRLLPKLPGVYSTSFLKFIATSFSKAESEELSDNYKPPQVHQNSIASGLRFARSGDYLFGAFLLAGASYPLFALVMSSVLYTAGLNALVYELSRRTVVRMDLLPNQQTVNFVKVGAFGLLHNSVVRIEDLEHVEFSELESKENYFWGLHYSRIDVDLIFRDKNTKELFLFDRKAFWSKEGLEHELLN